MKKYRTLALVCGYGLSAISMLFTMRLLMSFAASPIESIMYGAFGCLIQIAQTILFVIGCYAIKQNRSGAMTLCFSLYGVLFVLSICGTLGSFSRTSKQNTQTAELSDVRFQQYQSGIAGIDKQIESCNQQIKEYASRNYFTNGVKPVQAQLEKLQADRKELLSKIESHRVIPSGEAMYNWIGEFLQVEPQQVKLVMFTAYGVCLDLAAAILLAFGCGALLKTEEDAEFETEYYPSRQVSGIIPQSHAAAIAEKKVGYISEAGNQSGVPANQVRTENVYAGNGNVTSNSNVTGNITEAAASSTDKVLNLELLRQYINLLFPQRERKNGSLVSRRHIQDWLSLDTQTTDEIHKLLKRKGFIRSEGQFSYPNKTKDEMLLLSDTLLNESGHALVSVLLIIFLCAAAAFAAFGPVDKIEFAQKSEIRAELETVRQKVKLEKKACDDELKKALANADGLNLYCLVLGFDVFDVFNANIHDWWLSRCELGFTAGNITVPDADTIKLKIPEKGGYRIAGVSRSEFMRFARLMNEICQQAGIAKPFDVD